VKSLEKFADQASEEILRAAPRVPMLQEIPCPPETFGTPIEAFENALAHQQDHEQEVTASIHALYAVAGEPNDVAAQRELDWFVTEQVEEEENAGRAVGLLTRAGEDSSALLFLDREFGSRAGGSEGH